MAMTDKPAACDQLVDSDQLFGHLWYMLSLPWTTELQLK
jgi:hypothetical protein